MRFGIGLVGLLVALALVAVLAKQQLRATHVEVPAATSSGTSAPAGATTVREQSRQVQEQVRQQVETLMQQPRPMPENEQ